MNYRFVGKLQAYICEACPQVLAGTTVRLYRHRANQEVAALVAAQPKTTFTILEDADVEARSDLLIAETSTNERGEFTFNLSEEAHDYHGLAFAIDVRLASIPDSGIESDREPVQFTITSLQPEWTEGEEQGYLVAKPWFHAISARFWCYLLAYYDIWVICGRFVTCKGKTPLPGATVRAFDTDWIQDDPLGGDLTDANGRFRIYYTSTQFKKTPFPSILYEVESGPDVYFQVEFGGDLVVDEDRSVGRTPGRENVGHCFCVEICTDKLVGPNESDTPHWERVEEFEVDTDFTAEGYAGGGFLVMHDIIDLHGNMPLVNSINNKALRYRFLIGEWDWPGGVENPAVLPSVPPADADLKVVDKIHQTKVGYIYYDDANGVPRSAPVNIEEGDLDADGCIKLLGMNVNVDMYDSTFADIPITISNFVGAYLLLEMNSQAVTPPPYNNTDDLGHITAGNPVATGDRAPVRRFKVRFQVFDFDQAVDNTTSNKTLDALVIDNSPVKYALNLSELDASLCNPITTNVHILYTLDHPHLKFFDVRIENNNGVVHSAPPLPNGAFGGSFFFRGGANGPGGFNVIVAGDPPCAYAEILRWQTRHYQAGRGGVHQQQMLYCK